MAIMATRLSFCELGSVQAVRLDNKVVCKTWECKIFSRPNPLMRTNRGRYLFCKTGFYKYGMTWNVSQIILDEVATNNIPLTQLTHFPCPTRQNPRPHIRRFEERKNQILLRKLATLQRQDRLGQASFYKTLRSLFLTRQDFINML